MKFFLTYLFLSIKKNIKICVSSLFSSLLLIALVLSVAFLGTRLLYQDQKLGTIQLGFYTDPDKELDEDTNETAISIIENQDSIARLCNIQRYDYREGISELKKGKINAFIIMPENIINDIAYGENTPIEVITMGNSGLESFLFTELCSSAATTLSSAQACIYSVTDFCRAHGYRSYVSEVLDELNLLTFRYAFSRGPYFAQQEVSATNQLTTLQYYIVSAFVLFLFLFAIPFAKTYAEPSLGISKKLNTVGIRPALQLIIDMVSLALTFFLFVGVMVLLLSIVSSIGGFNFHYQVVNYIGLFFLLLSMASFFIFLFRICQTSMGGVNLLFLSSVILIFLSGGFVPLSFLPNTIKNISAFLPTTLWLKEAGNLFWGQTTLEANLKFILLSILFGCITFLMGKRRERLA
ncbi:MAG: ABC transporter permease [Lachnospiraceae bacterium]|nr:ABC transporter permease [Lachnospiraceae bacterium]